MNTSIFFLLLIYKLINATIPKCNSVEGNEVCSLDPSYDKNVPPSTVNQPVHIDVGVELYHISDINEEKHTITIVGYVAHSWVDPSLKLPNNTTLPLALDHLLNAVWIPSTHFDNSVQVRSIPNMKATGKKLFIYHSYLTLIDALAITFECKMNFAHFPFDQQNCAFEVIGGYASHDASPEIVLNQMSLTTRQGPNAIEASSPNDLTTFNSSGLPFEIQLETPKPSLITAYDGTMQRVTLDFHFARKSEEFHKLLCSYFVPSGAFALMSLFSFFIKPEVVPGRMGMLVTIFLIVISIYRTVEAPSKRDFGYLDIWYIGVQVPILFALSEYGLILAALKYTEVHQEIVLWGKATKINHLLKILDFVSFCLNLTLILTFSTLYLCYL